MEPAVIRLQSLPEECVIFLLQVAAGGEASLLKALTMLTFFFLGLSSCWRLLERPGHMVLTSLVGSQKATVFLLLCSPAERFFSLLFGV